MPLHRGTKWLLAPGTLCTPRVFDPMLEYLAPDDRDRDFITLDAPHVEDFHDRLQAQVTTEHIVCGFSLGSIMLAHNLDALHNARAAVLVACNPFADRMENRTNREAIRDRVLAGDARGWVQDNWVSMAANGSDALMDFVATMAMESAPLIPNQTELAASRPGAVEALLESDVPLLFVTGSQDQLTPAAPLAAIVRDARQASLQVVEGLGHFALTEDPYRVAAAIRRGLADLDQNPTLEGLQDAETEYSRDTA
ncbi:MAG: alpha/beta hydrolase [Pseudomonadota bacterium]